jgi:hypothetical protein
MKHERRTDRPAARRVPAYIAALGMVAALAVTLTTTLALFTDVPDGAENKATLGYVDSELDEGEGWNDKSPTPAEVSPRGSVAKAPKVTNNGSLPVYARILVAGGTDKFEFTTAEPVEDASWDEFEDLYDNEDETSAWKLEEDGYYYYIKGGGILEPKKSTTALFTNVKLKRDFGGGDDELDIIVYAEVIQTISYDGKPFGSPQYAFAALSAPDTDGEH